MSQSTEPGAEPSRPSAPPNLDAEAAYALSSQLKQLQSTALSLLNRKEDIARRLGIDLPPLVVQEEAGSLWYWPVDAEVERDASWLYVHTIYQCLARLHSAVGSHGSQEPVCGTGSRRLLSETRLKPDR